MTQKISKMMNDSPLARWTVLVLVALMMFFAYMFVDVMSPLKSLVESKLGWDSGVFGKYAASEYILNVCGFLILAGIILDKLGVRFSGILSAGLMVFGAGMKFIAVSDWFQSTAFCGWLDSWWVELPGSAKMASLGFMIFGCGCEMEGTNVSKILAKWFKGKEMALAMGLEMAIARLGVFGVMWIAPLISEKFDNSILAPVGFCGALLVIGLINFIIFGIMDRKFDSQLVDAGLATAEKSPEDEFHISDLKAIFTSKMFWIVSLLCVLYYSAIFPFQRYATNFLEETLAIDAASAAKLFSCFPILAMVMTPMLGIFLDRKGKGATMLMFGSIIMIVCHLSFAFILPAFPQKWFALLLIVVLGISFSLVPAALWPSVPKIIDEKILGSAYCLIFWVQNIGLCLVPMLIGSLRASTGSYFVPMLVFSSFGVLAFILSIYLKAEDKKKGYGLELPNISK
ncbi:MAG: MFS transporter [Bacteroides sp.]|nr:MFS transporter [Bacteroidales bacterium]MCI6679715.1 MFS transporter [Bacteroides sp.]MDD7490927.1 MFS transporter [Bacteroides sp.]MDY5890661.1 MFS transporter [Candidatus Cryptobacteroides sp.]CCX57043.1 transporter major facilitator family protein [Bacteroides sp. CAG:1060]